MAKGGKRPGAGRPKGAKNKATAKAAARAAAVQPDATPAEIMPVDVQLAAMRRHFGLAKAYEAAEKDAPDLADIATVHFNAAATFARFASPYFHSKLTPAPPLIDDGPIGREHDFSDIELAQRVAFIFERAARALKKE